jgi:hypothetical protein
MAGIRKMHDRSGHRSTESADITQSLEADVAAEIETEVDIRSEVLAKIKAKTKAFNPALATGAANRYDLRSYDCDYTAGGALEGKFVNADESRLAIAKAEGYDVPSAWSSKLDDLKLGSQVLMLRPAELGAIKRKHDRQRAAELEAQTDLSNAPQFDKDGFGKYYTSAERQQESLSISQVADTDADKGVIFPD